MKQLLFILVLTSSLAYGKKDDLDTFLVQKEAEIGLIITNLREAESDNQRFIYNEELKAELKNLLKYPGVMDHPFESWVSMSTIASPDGAFRIFNWNIEDENLVHTHYCYLVKPRQGTRPNIVYEFKEDKITLPRYPTNTLTPAAWYGALYYKIIPIQKGRKTYYTILGFSGNDRSTNKKLIDVFYFKGKSLRLGFPLFQESKGSSVLLRRVFFEYSEKAVVTVNMNEKLGAIVFDHLIPESPSLVGMRDFYIPDMTYDGYRWEDGMWKYEEDLIAYNDPNRRIEIYGPTDDGDGSEYVSVPDEWVDPVDDGNPLNGGDATAPIEDVRDDKSDAENGTSNTAKKKRKFRLFKRRVKPISAIGDDGSHKKKKKKKKKKDE